MPHHQEGRCPEERVEYELSDVAASSSASYLQGGAPLSAPNRILICSNKRKEREIQNWLQPPPLFMGVLLYLLQLLYLLHQMKPIQKEMMLRSL